MLKAHMDEPGTPPVVRKEVASQHRATTPSDDNGGSLVQRGHPLFAKTSRSPFVTACLSRFDNVPSLRAISVSSRVKSLKRILQGPLRLASLQSWIATSLGHPIAAEVIMARIDCS